MEETTTGYDIQLFLDRTMIESMNLSCLICFGVMNHAVNGPCGHCFCRSCMAAVVDERCPKCRAPCDPMSLSNNAFVNTLIQATLKIQCPSRLRPDLPVDSCCSWTGDLVSLPTHQAHCAFVEATCADCSVKYLRRDQQEHAQHCTHRLVSCSECKCFVSLAGMENHKTHDCKFISEPCPSCNQMIIRKDSKRHFEQECVVPCPDCNQSTFTRKTLQFHQLNTCLQACTAGCQAAPMSRATMVKHLRTDCPMVARACAYHRLGCKSVLNAPEMRDHIEKGNIHHLMLVEETHAVPLSSYAEAYDKFSQIQSLLTPTFVPNAELVRSKDLIKLRVQLLLNVPVDQEFKGGSTPLGWACYRGDEEAIELLLEFKADVNKADHMGYTPFLEACRVTSKESIEVLVRLMSAGAKTDAKTNDGKGWKDIAAPYLAEKLELYLC